MTTGALLAASMFVALAGAARAQGTPPQPSQQPSDGQQPPVGYPPAEPPAGYPPETPPPQQPQPQQPQPGYPQQPYPQPGPQPGYPQQPYPQPAYPAPQPYPGGAYPAPPPPPRSPFLAMVYLGANVFAGDQSDNYGPGFRIGTILGLRLMPFLSLNGELTIDVLNVKGASSDITAAAVDFTVSPLVHLPVGGNLELVAGPKLGGFDVSVSESGSSSGISARGYVYGLNVGGFAAISPSSSIGALLSFEERDYAKICTTESGFDQVCQTSGLGSPDKIFGFTGAILF